MTEGEIAAILKRIEESDEKSSGRFTNIESHLETINGSVLTLLKTSEEHEDKLVEVGLWQARWEGAWLASRFAIPIVAGLVGAVLGALIGRGL